MDYYQIIKPSKDCDYREVKSDNDVTNSGHDVDKPNSTFVACPDPESSATKIVCMPSELN